MIKILKFLNLLSFDNTLSLTNLLFYIVCIMFIIHPCMEINITLFLTLLNYAHKRTISDSRNVVVNRQSEEISNLRFKQIQQDNVMNTITTQLDTLVKEHGEVSDKVGSISVALGGNNGRH